MSPYNEVSGSHEVRRLVEIEKKSSAVETLFTIALVLFAQGQLTATLYSPNMELGELMLMAGGIFMGLGVIGVSLLLGGDVLIEVWKKEIPWYEEEWEYIE